MKIFESGSRIGILTIIVGAIITGIFKALFPLVNITEIITVILICSIVISLGINFCWKRWIEKRREK